MMQHTQIETGAIVRHAGSEHRALWQAAGGLVVETLDARGWETGVRETLTGLVEVANAWAKILLR